MGNYGMEEELHEKQKVSYISLDGYENFEYSTKFNRYSNFQYISVFHSGYQKSKFLKEISEAQNLYYFDINPEEILKL